MNSLNISDEDAASSDDWSKFVIQILLLVVPRYFVGANADNMGSKDPISTVVPVSVKTYD